MTEIRPVGVETNGTSRQDAPAGAYVRPSAGIA